MTVSDLTRRPEPIVLVILDGWGVSAGWGGNLLAQARPEVFTRLWHEYPHVVAQALSPADLALGGVGSSDIGHASIGTGRLSSSDLAQISAAIADRSFFTAPAIQALTELVAAERGALHLVGLASEGRVHSALDHLYALLEVARLAGVAEVYVHAITDGVDVADGQARATLEQIVTQLGAVGVGQLATVLGRSSAMDRSGAWQQTRAAVRALTGVAGRRVTSLDQLWELVAAGHESDAEIVPSVLVANGRPVGPVRPSDVVVCWNVRADRMQQLVRGLADPHALAWLGLVRRERLAGAHVRTLTDYALTLPDVAPIFRSAESQETLGRILADHGIPHARVGTSDRSAHLSYFLNGGHREPYLHEERQLVALPPGDAAAQPDQPMRAVAAHTLRLIHQRRHPVIVVNLDAVDRAAHSGDAAATSRAIGAVDRALGDIHAATLAAGGALIVTADHGNAESMLQSRAGRRHTSHGVPIILALPERRQLVRLPVSKLAPTTGVPDQRWSLADITPTILALLGIAKPSAMTGRSLLSH